MKFHTPTLLLCGLALCLSTNAPAQTAPQPAAQPAAAKTAPAVVTPAAVEVLVAAPSDAIVLFDGRDLSQWCRKDGSPAPWEIADGALVVKPKSGPIFTRQNFGDCQLHLEWNTPENVQDTGQLRSNSGVFLQNQYEVQILDSYKNDTYWNGQAGSIYKQYAPLVNATKAPGRWNVYDIIYTAPRFDATGALLSPAYITLLHNGIIVQNHTPIKGTTFIEKPAYTAHGNAPIMLQDHGNPIRFRNIWIREL